MTSTRSAGNGGAGFSQDAGLSPQVLSEIAAIERAKAARSPLQQKTDSRLAHEIALRLGRALPPGVPRRATGIVVEPDGRVVVDVRARVTPSLTQAVATLGFDTLYADARYDALRLRGTFAAVDALAALSDVLFVQPKQEAITTRRAGAIRPADRARGMDALASALLTGPNTSQGDATHQAALARSAFGVDGTGVKIGVLSDGVAGLASSQGRGDLGAVTVLPGQAGTGDEGTAMLEIIHDLAPGAELYFATAFTSITSFAQNIRDLRAAGCDIIVDDVFYYEEAPFQDGQTGSTATNGGVVTQAVNDVTATGAMYFSSAGNQGNIDSGTSGTWEGDFVDGGDFSTGGPVLGRMHLFGAQPFNALSTSSSAVTLSWADPLGASANDYDLYVTNSSGTSLIGWSNNSQDGNDDPFEGLGNPPPGSRFYVVRSSGSGRFLHLDTYGGRIDIATPGQTHGHAAASAAHSFGVAATRAMSPGPYPGSFSASDTIENFSSDGPRRIFFTGSGAAITAGNFSSTGGQLLMKPDITAADGVSTGVPGYLTFFGTSAAAPHAAAIAALIKSADLSLTPAQVKAALLAGAIDIHAPGVDRNSGAGIVMAYASIGPLVAPVIETVSPSSGSSAGGTVLTITGRRFHAGATSVTLGGNSASAVSATTTSLTAEAPPHAAGPVTVTVTTPVGSASLASGFTYFTSLFSDDPLQAGVTRIRAVHVTELRSYIDTLRTRYGLTAAAWSDPGLSAGLTPVRAIHIAQLRAALQEAYVASGRSAPSFTDAVLSSSTAIRAVHIVELRAAIAAIY